MPWIPAQRPLSLPATKWLSEPQVVVVDGAHFWWDGSTLVAADLLGYWDGAAIQPVEALGYWDGAVIQPFGSGTVTPG